MKKFIVTFDVPGEDEYRVLCVEANEQADALVKAAMRLDDEDRQEWSLVSVDPMPRSAGH